MTGFWRIAVVALVLVNSGLLLLRVLERPSPAAPSQSPVDPAIPQADLLGEDASAEARATAPRCFTIGPMATQVQQQRAEDRLTPFANSLRLRTTEADSDRGWWVFVAAANRSAAIDTARELAERGVEDYFVVADRDLPDAVSLGLFERRENARRRRSEIRELGFDAQMSIRRETVPQFWIDYQVDPGQRAPWRFILRASPGARMLPIPCWSSPSNGEAAGLPRTSAPDPAHRARRPTGPD